MLLNAWIFTLFVCKHFFIHNRRQAQAKRRLKMSRIWVSYMGHFDFKSLIITDLNALKLENGGTLLKRQRWFSSTNENKDGLRTITSDLFRVEF